MGEGGEAEEGGRVGWGEHRPSRALSPPPSRSQQGAWRKAEAPRRRQKWEFLFCRKRWDSKEWNKGPSLPVTQSLDFIWEVIGLVKTSQERGIPITTALSLLF